jgi:hypothetical protein
MSTAFCARVETALQALYKRDWIGRGEKLLNVMRGDLDLLGEPMPDDAAELIEDIVSAKMRERADALRAQAAALDAAACKFNAGSNTRRLEIEIAERCKTRTEIDALFEIIAAQSMAAIEREQRAT